MRYASDHDVRKALSSATPSLLRFFDVESIIKGPDAKILGLYKLDSHLYRVQLLSMASKSQISNSWTSKIPRTVFKVFKQSTAINIRLLGIREAL